MENTNFEWPPAFPQGLFFPPKNNTFLRNIFYFVFFKNNEALFLRGGRRNRPNCPGPSPIAPRKKIPRAGKPLTPIYLKPLPPAPLWMPAGWLAAGCWLLAGLLACWLAGCWLLAGWLAARTRKTLNFCLELVFVFYLKLSWKCRNIITSKCVDSIWTFPGHFQIESLLAQKTSSFPTSKTDFFAGTALTAIIFIHFREIPK